MKYLAVLLVLIACNQPAGTAYRAFLEPCNQVNIIVYNGGDTLYFNTQDSAGVDILKNLITGSGTNNITDTCAAHGRLEYMRDSTQLFTAKFAAALGDSEDNCNYIAYSDDDNRYTHRLSERAQKLLNRVMQTVPVR